MADLSERNSTSGLMLGVALALLIAVIVYAVVLPQARRGGLPDIDIEQEVPAPERTIPIEPGDDHGGDRPRPERGGDR